MRFFKNEVILLSRACPFLIYWDTWEHVVSVSSKRRVKGHLSRDLKL